LCRNAATSRSTMRPQFQNKYKQLQSKPQSRNKVAPHTHVPARMAVRHCVRIYECVGSGGMCGSAAQCVPVYIFFFLLPTYRQAA